MKIKLMIISLVAVLGLQGMDRGQLAVTKAVTNDESALKKAFEFCINHRFQRQIASCCFKKPKSKKEIDNSIRKVVIGNGCDRVGRYFVESANAFVHSCFNADEKKMCNIYSITGEKLAQDLESIKTFIKLNKETHFVITANNLADITYVIEQLRRDGTDVKQFGYNLMDHVETIENDSSLKSYNSKKKLSASELAQKIFDRAQKIEPTGKKSQPGLISNLRAFFTNHWGKLAGGSLLAAALAYYYYNVAR